MRASHTMKLQRSNMNLNLMKIFFVVLFPVTIFFGHMFMNAYNVVEIGLSPVASFVATVTHYSFNDSCHYKGCPNAAGKIPTVGTVACSRKYPLGTMMRIDGKIYECQDRLARRYDNRVDIFVNSSKEALQLGKKKILVEILKLGKINNEKMQGM